MDFPSRFRVAALIGLAGLLMRATIAVAASNNPPGPPPDGQRPPGPPREALEACAGKKAGDSVTIKTPDGQSKKATCTLVAVPADHPERGSDRPPMQK
jgi:hypothetical protein